MALNAVAKKWVRALRSGKYKQTKHVLTRLKKDGVPQSHCCLGVLCELAIKSGVSVNITPNTTDKSQRYDGKDGVLPPSVQKWAGLTSCDGTFEHTDLTSLNDDGKSFKTIADIIVKHQKQLFVQEKA